MTANTRHQAAKARLLKALSHPLRQRILNQLNRGEASPSELAERLGEPLGNVSYHVKVLLDHDTIELVRTQPVRGAVEHFYRATTRAELDDQQFAELPLSARRSLFDKTLHEVWEHVAAAASTSGFDDPKTHVSWLDLDLDEQGYGEAVDLLAETLERLMEIQAGAVNRSADGGPPERARRTQAVLMHFHRAPAGAS